MSMQYQANTSNQYTRIESSESVPSTKSVDEPRYDKLGNLLQDTRNTYTWDADIHLMSVATKSNDQLGTKNQEQRTDFKYDALHRRVARTESDTQTSTFFIHDGWNVIAEHQSGTGLQPVSPPSGAAANTSPVLPVSQSPHLTARHVWAEDLSGTLQGAGGIGGLLASTHNSSSTKNDEQRTTNSFLHYDSNGNVILLTDAGGEESARYQYDAFGKTILAQGSAANLNRYRFSTKPIEEVSGLAFYGYRYYSLELGRWPSRDPMGEMGGLNIYSMVGNCPLHNVDLLGLTQNKRNCRTIKRSFKHRLEKTQLNPSVYSLFNVYTSAELEYGADVEICEVECCEGSWKESLDFGGSVTAQLEVGAIGGPNGSLKIGSFSGSYWAGVKGSATASVSGTIKGKTGGCSDSATFNASVDLGSKATFSVGGSASMNLATNGWSMTAVEVTGNLTLGVKGVINIAGISMNGISGLSLGNGTWDQPDLTMKACLLSVCAEWGNDKTSL